MKMYKILLFAFLLAGLNVVGNAQKLMPGAFDFSQGKTVYITLTDGSEVEGLLNSVDQGKGLIKKLLVKDANGKEIQYLADQIERMYIVAEEWNPSAKRYSFIGDASRWDNHNYKKELFNNGYVVFEQATVEMGRKNRNMLMQLLNPSFSSQIKIYKNPFLTETTVNQKQKESELTSYYVKDGGRPAFLLSEGNLQNNFVALFGDCQSMLPLKKKANWDQFDQYVYNYSLCK